MLGAQEKAARRRLLNSNLMIEDQAAINAGFDFRRYAMKPTPAKPRIIIAQVEGSGTAPAEKVTLSMPKASLNHSGKSRLRTKLSFVKGVSEVNPKNDPSALPGTTGAERLMPFTRINERVTGNGKPASLLNPRKSAPNAVIAELKVISNPVLMPVKPKTNGELLTL
jgi:hypothetical protein